MNSSVKVAVLVKQVPHPEHFGKIVVDPVKMAIRREGIPTIMNPLDKIAVEMALRFRETCASGAKLDAISMGPPSAREVLDEALAMGADGGILLCDRALAGADTLATAKTIAAALRRLGPYALIVAGSETVDGGTGQVPVQVAEFLSVPHVTGVVAMRPGDGPGRVAVERKVEGGRYRLAVRLPAVLAFVRGAAEPRIPSALDVVRAARKPLEVLGIQDLGLPPEDAGLMGSPTRVSAVGSGRLRRGQGGAVFSGEPGRSVEQALKRLKELGAL